MAKKPDGSSDVDFAKLLRDSMVLVSHVDTGVPSIQRNISQLDTMSRKLATQSRAAPRDSDAQAQLFYASKGLDMSQQSSTLRSIDLSKTYEPLEALAVLALDQFLAHNDQMTFASCIEESTQLVAQTSRRHYVERMDADWADIRRDLLDQYGMRHGQSALSAVEPAGLLEPPRAGGAQGGRALLDRSLVSVTRGGAKTVMTFEQDQFSKCIQAINARRREHLPYPVVAALKQAAKNVDDYNDKSAQGGDSDVVDALETLRAMVGEGDVVPATPSSVLASPAVDTKSASSSSAPGERSMGKDYLNNALKLKQKLVDGARRSAERQYAQYIKATIDDNRRVAQVKGRVGIRQDVRGFLNIMKGQWPRDVDMFNEMPLWAQIFYCYRCGFARDALAILTEAQSHNLCDVRELINCLQKRVDVDVDDRTRHRGLPEAMWKKLNEEYNKEMNGASNSMAGVRDRSRDAAAPDPYKAAMYILVGRFKPHRDVDLFRLVCPTTEDYMWLKLCTVWVSEDALPDWLYSEKDAHTLSLQHLQDTLLRLGEAHFNSDGRNPLRYFKVLLMSQQFEQACYYIVRTEHFGVGVHIAAVLDYYGLLRRSEGSQELLSPSLRTPGAFALNFVRIIRKYVEPFLRTNPVEAFHYLYLLHVPQGTSASGYLALPAPGSERKDTITNGGTSGVNDDDAAILAVAELLVETKEYGQLIGTTRGDQVMKNGCIYTHFPPEDAPVIVTQAGRISEDKGAYIDAIKLYTLAERNAQVAQLLVKCLSRVCSAPTNTPERQQLAELARRFLSSSSVVRVMSTSGAAHQPATPTRSLLLTAPSPFRANTSAIIGGGSAAAGQGEVVVAATSLTILLKLVQFFDLYHLGPDRWTDALDVLDSLAIIGVRDDQSDLEEKVSRFERLPDSIRRNFADVAVATMEMYYNQHKQAKNELARSSGATPAIFGAQTPRDASRHKSLRDLRGKARALVNFVGMTQFMIGADINAKLVHLEALMS